MINHKYEPDENDHLCQHDTPGAGGIIDACDQPKVDLVHRIPLRFCTYAVPTQAVGKVGGPNALGEYLVAVGAEIIPGGRQRVGWCYATEHDLAAAGIRPVQRRPPAGRTPELYLVPVGGAR